MPQFKMSPRFRAPGGEPLAAGQSSNTVSGTTKFYNKHAAGNAMASILGQENVPNQQFGGAFNQASASFGGAQQSGAYDEPEYPLPGSSASCDSCGEVINAIVESVTRPSGTKSLNEIADQLHCANRGAR